MLDFIKKTMLAGLGAAVVTKETVQKSMQELVAKGKLSAEDAGKAADSIVAQGRAEFEKAKDDLAKAMEQAMNKANIASAEKVEALSAEVKALQLRVEALEGKPQA